MIIVVVTILTVCGDKFGGRRAEEKIFKILIVVTDYNNNIIYVFLYDNIIIIIMYT